MQADPAAVEILRALAWLAPTNLPRQVVSHPDTTREGESSTANADVDDLLGLLASYSLITLTTYTIDIHRLLQATVREHDRIASSPGQIDAGGLTGGQATALAWLVAAVPAEPGTNVAGWRLWRDLLPHLDAFFDHLPQEMGNPDFAKLLGQTAFYLAMQGRYTHALRLNERAVAIAEAALGPDHTDTGDLLEALLERIQEE